jgi:hypothetical protein
VQQQLELPLFFPFVRSLGATKENDRKGDKVNESDNPKDVIDD